MIRVILTNTCLYLVGAAAGVAPAAGGDPLVEKLLGDAPVTGPEEVAAPSVRDSGADLAPADVSTMAGSVARIAEGFADARGLLDARETGEKTRAAQRQVIEHLDRLIAAAEAARSEASQGENGATPTGETSPPSDASGSSGEEEADGSTSARGRPDGPGSRRGEDNAERSSGRVSDGASGVVREFRSDLARDVWGHLPARLRERILNAEADESLPQYDGLVRRYFESLAGAGADDAE